MIFNFLFLRVYINILGGQYSDQAGNILLHYQQKQPCTIWDLVSLVTAIVFHELLCTLYHILPSQLTMCFSGREDRYVLGASVRHSARGKGHEEGGSAYAKAGSSLRSPPGNSRASTPKTRVCLLSALCSHLHLWLYGGGCPRLPFSEKRVNL